ncbi:hypothetical protein K3727_10475 [Rhodobacteraceae bacterium M382]|nr:hypothetical protein K3727_10475 [Rhodobacteraceae bacterium M382]
MTNVTTQITRIVQAIAKGMFSPCMENRMSAVEARKVELTPERQPSTNEPPVWRHPGLADVHQENVASLPVALNEFSSKAEATSLIRSLLSEIPRKPDGDALTIEIVGELAGWFALGVAQKQTRPPEGGLFDSSGCGSRI